MVTSEISDRKVVKRCLHPVEKVVYLSVEDKAHVGRVFQENKTKNRKKKSKMKKTMKKVAKVKSIMTEKPKSVLVKPTAHYTKDEVRSFLGLSKGSCLSPKYYPGMGGRGKVPGTAVIAYLEKSCKRAKIGRRYASGTVTVVAR